MQYLLRLLKTTTIHKGYFSNGVFWLLPMETLSEDRTASGNQNNLLSLFRYDPIFPHHGREYAQGDRGIVA